MGMIESESWEWMLYILSKFKVRSNLTMRMNRDIIRLYIISVFCFANCKFLFLRRLMIWFFLFVQILISCKLLSSFYKYRSVESHFMLYFQSTSDCHRKKQNREFNKCLRWLSNIIYKWLLKLYDNTFSQETNEIREASIWVSTLKWCCQKQQTLLRPLRCRLDAIWLKEYRGESWLWVNVHAHMFRDQTNNMCSILACTNRFA